MREGGRQKSTVERLVSNDWKFFFKLWRLTIRSMLLSTAGSNGGCILWASLMHNIRLEPLVRTSFPDNNIRTTM
jgi:hypothetical protein